MWVKMSQISAFLSGNALGVIMRESITFLVEIAKRYMCHESDRVPQEASLLPDKALADDLITAYFTHIILATSYLTRRSSWRSTRTTILPTHRHF
jgi:hypothetical protein